MTGDMSGMQRGRMVFDFAKSHSIMPLFLLIFFILYVFFYSVAIAIPYIMDDWVLFCSFKSLLPDRTMWNPARILAEILQPAAGQIAVYLVMPFTDNYIEAVRITASFIAALSITILCVALVRLMKAYENSISTAIMSMLLFMGMAFCLFKMKNECLYLFYSWALTILFAYTIPNILNSILVIGFLMAQHSGLAQLAKRKYCLGIAVLIIYLAQFSITTASLISAIMAGTLLVIRMLLRSELDIASKLYHSLRHPELFDLLLWFTLICWVCAAVFDLNGARYAWFGETSFALIPAFEELQHLFSSLRKPIILLFMMFVCSSIILFLYENRQWKLGKKIISSDFALSFCAIAFSFMLMTIAIICIAGKTSSVYANRISFSYGIFFYLLLLTIICFAYCMKKCKNFKIIVPFILCWLFIDSTQSTYPYPRPITNAEIEMVNGWVNKARLADEAGNKIVEITVPKGYYEDSKDSNDFLRKCISKVLYNAGVTSRPLIVNFRIDPQREFYCNIK